MKALNSGDFIRTDVETNKQFTLTSASSYLTYAIGEQQVGTFFTESAETTTNGIYKGSLYGYIKTKFYTDKYKEETTQSLAETASLIKVSQQVFDKKIKEGSVTLVMGSETYTDDSFGNIKSGSGEFIGNIFYEEGAIVLTTGSFLSNDSPSFDLTFRSTHDKTTLEILSTIKPNEFNISTNPTATFLTARPSGSELAFYRPRYTYHISEVTSSYGETITSQSIIPEFFGLDPSGSVDKRLTPYITTIGYYNDDLELLAVAKVATATPIPTDFPITFKARIDI